jgi:hypothetical protein
VLGQQAQTWRRSLPPCQGETIDVILEAAKHATRGSAMDAIAKMKDPTPDPSIRGHQDVGAILVGRDHVLPVGLRLYVQQAHGPALGRPCRKTTEWAAPWSRECKAPPGVKVAGQFEASSLGPAVVQACRVPRVPCASTRKSQRRLFTQGWTLKAGRSGRHLCRRRRADPRALWKPSGQVH